MNDKINVIVKEIPPFKRMCMTIGELPSSYLETMTYYEMLVWFVNYLQNTVIPTIDNNALAVKELQDLFVKLQDYVNNYFDNLDVQEEINNKLDEMVDDGTLPEIIASYLNSNAIFGYDSVADMKAATNFVDGSNAKTLGFYTINDGGGASYKIRTKTELDTPDEITLIAIGDSLVAELLIDNECNVKQFGAKGDGTTDDSTAFTTMFATTCEKYYIPKGDYIVNHNVCNMTSLDHDIVIYGDGYNLSKLNLKDSVISADFQPMFLIQNNSANQVKVEIKDLYFNMNRTNNDGGYEPTGFELQHCHAINLNSTSVNGISAIIKNIEFYDCIADGVCFTGQLSTNTFNSIIVENIIATHHIGTRDDVCITGDFNNAILNNLNVDCFEVEVNNYNSDSKHNLIVNNLITRKRFDIDGHYDINSANNPTNYLINNANITGIIYATSVKAKISNSILNFNGTVLRPNHADLEFDNCYINDDFKTADSNAMISLNHDQYGNIIIRNSKINCNNSQFFYFNDTDNINHKKYAITLMNNIITGTPSGSYVRVTSSDVNVYDNIVDFSANKYLVYLGTINNSFDINLRGNKLINNGYLLINSGSLSEEAAEGTVVNIRSKNNESNTVGHLINWTNLEDLTAYRGGEGSLYNVIEVDDFEYNRQPNTGKWIKGQRCYNTLADGTTLGWVATASGSSSEASFEVF